MRSNSERASTWVVDYSEARAHAIKWLGDRYLLARPINGSRYPPRPMTPGICSPVAAEPGEAVPSNRAKQGKPVPGRYT
jgi:hypothetical protein